MSGAGFCHHCHRVRGSFIPPQDHARHSVLHALYAARKHHSSTLGPRAVTGMRDAGYELPRIRIPRAWVNKGTERRAGAITPRPPYKGQFAA